MPGRIESVLFVACAWLVFGCGAQPLATDSAYAVCLASPQCVSMYCQVPTPSRQAFDFIVGSAAQAQTNNTLIDLFALAATQAPRCAIGQKCEWSFSDNSVQCVGSARSGTPSASGVMIFIAAIIASMSLSSCVLTCFGRKQ